MFQIYNREREPFHTVRRLLKGPLRRFNSARRFSSYKLKTGVQTRLKLPLKSCNGSLKVELKASLGSCPQNEMFFHGTVSLSWVPIKSWLTHEHRDESDLVLRGLMSTESLGFEVLP